MTAPLPDLGARLRHLREERGWPIVVLAERTGIDASNLGAYEAGRHTPTMPTLSRILAAFGLQFAIEFEPLYADLDAALDAAAAASPSDLLRQRGWLRGVFEETSSIPVVVTGDAALVLHGLDVPVQCCDVLMARDRMAELAAAVRRLYAARWSGPWGFGFAEQDPREPGPLWWSVGQGELKVTVVDKLPRAVSIAIADYSVHVVPLYELEVADRAAARLVGRARQRLASAS